MVFLVTQFPKPVITEHWEDLPPARLKEVAPVAKGPERWVEHSLGAGRLVKHHLPSVTHRTFHTKLMCLAWIYFPQVMTWGVAWVV